MHVWRWQERRLQKGEGRIGPTVLYFGCQHRSKDFLYEDELLAAFDDKVLSELHTAFSREQENKVYVQHKVSENSKRLVDTIEAGGYLYICGYACLFAGRSRIDSGLWITSAVAAADG